jgi:hypothetical protein
MAMTPKEKATELIQKFTRIEDDSTFYWEPYYDKGYTDDEILPHAKKCANVVCDEAIKLTNLMDGGFSFEKEIEFWKNVKSEIDAI